MLAFQLPVQQPYQLRLFNLSGRLIFSQQATGTEGENSLVLHLGEVAPGLYLLDFQSETLKAQRRLAVQR